jgi:hypothetical protein
MIEITFKQYLTNIEYWNQAMNLGVSLHLTSTVKE